MPRGLRLSLSFAQRSFAHQDVLLSRPDEEAHEEEGAGGLIGAQQTRDSCWRGGFPLNDVKRIMLTEYVTCSDLW